MDSRKQIATLCLVLLASPGPVGAQEAGTQRQPADVGFEPAVSSVGVVAGVFLSNGGAIEKSRLHIAAAFTGRSSSHILGAAVELGLLPSTLDPRLALALALKFDLQPRAARSVYLRGGPSLFLGNGVGGGFHVAAGYDAARVQDGWIAELCYYRTADDTASDDRSAFELLLSYQIGVGARSGRH